jgi:hypothetical protein
MTRVLADPAGASLLPSPRDHRSITSGASAHDPADGKSVIVMNGEIYNFRELGRDLAGVVLRSSPKVLLEGPIIGNRLVP